MESSAITIWYQGYFSYHGVCFRKVMSKFTELRPIGRRPSHRHHDEAVLGKLRSAFNGLKW